MVSALWGKYDERTGEQTMNKQIEEMAFDLCRIDTCKHLPQSECDKTTCAHCEAEALYNAGYRKQIEGDWVDQYNGAFANPIYACSVCDKGTLFKPHIDELGKMVMVQALSSFCPNCGAKMKNGKDKSR